MMLKLVIVISILIELIAAHGHFYEPPTRSIFRTVAQRNQQGCNVDWVTTYNTGAFFLLMNSKKVFLNL